MPKGRKTPGAARKPGAVWQGARPPVIRDLANSRARQVLTTASDPPAVLVDIANDAEAHVQGRVQAASAAAPRLSASVVATAPTSAKDDIAGPVERLVHRFARVAPPMPTIEAEPAEAGGD